MLIAAFPTQSQTLTALRAFLLSILPLGTEVIQGQANEVPEPKGKDFVVMTPIRRDRIETNTDTYADCFFTGSISGSTLTVTAIAYGTLLKGATIWGDTVAVGTQIISGPQGGGVGTYQVTGIQTAAPAPMACGTKACLQPTRLVVQLDVHSDGTSTQGADNAQVISTLFRDEYAVDAFRALSADVTPLYADDPKQIPFINDSNAYESRWVIEAHLQVNATVMVPQQFADQLAATLKPVEVYYPA